MGEIRPILIISAVFLALCIQGLFHQASLRDSVMQLEVSNGIEDLDSLKIQADSVISFNKQEQINGSY